MKTGKKTHWLRTTICVLLACGIAGVAISAVQFQRNPEKTYASATIQFSFSDAADGIAPNGYAFNVEDIRSGELVEAALAAAGLSDRYTAAQVLPMIGVSGSYPEDILTQLTSHTSLLDANASQMLSASSYYPTVYTISLSRDFDENISQAELENLLSCLMTAYRDYFARTSAMGVSTAQIDRDLSGYDYPQMLSVLSTQIEQTSNYAAEMSEKEPALSVNRQTFSDIGVMLDNLVNTNISRMNGLVSTYALTKDAARLRAQYEYEIQNRNNQLEKKKEQLKNLEQLVNAYQKSVAYVSTSEALVKVSSDSTETYDKLIEARRQVSEEIATLTTEIATYQLRLNDLLLTEQLEQSEEAKDGTAAAEQSAETAQAAAGAEEIVENTASETGEASAQAAAGTGETVRTTASETGEVSAQETTGTEEAVDTAVSETAETTDISAVLEDVDISAQQAALDAGIATLQTRQRNITSQFNELISAYNDQEINDATVKVSSIRYYAPSLLSGTFLVRAIKTAGPLCVLGLIVCLALIIINRRKEEKSQRKA